MLLLHNFMLHTPTVQISQSQLSNCTHGEIRLVGGGDPRKGRVEICIHNVWGTICSDGWSSADANVACSQLGYYPSGMGNFIYFPHCKQHQFIHTILLCYVSWVWHFIFILLLLLESFELNIFAPAFVVFNLSSDLQSNHNPIYSGLY